MHGKKAAMPIPATAQLSPPQSWEEFESICADLYTRIWNDDGTQKHGRQGQPQGGVDVYGRPDGKHYVGVQCKQKSIWPPTHLTIADIDEEVEKAKTWIPGVTHYIIATTAPNDEKLQAHVRKLTKAHNKKELFSVNVVSWDELTRRLTSYPDLLRKYYPNIATADVVQELTESIPVKTAKLILDQLRDFPSSAQIPRAATDIAKAAGREPAIVQALERDLSGRFVRAIRRSFFRETNKVDEFENLADIASETQYEDVAPDLRRRILLRASRSAAVRGSLDKAEALLGAAQALPGKDSDVVARARITERRGDIDGALALVRDENDADARSTVFNMLFKHRGGETALKWFLDEGLRLGHLTTNGVQTLTTAYLQKKDIDGLRSLLAELTPSQLDEAPYFRLVRAMIALASVLPVPERDLALRGFPLDVTRATHSILDEATTASRLDEALNDFAIFVPIAVELELREAKRLVESYIRWCELLHPYRKDAGLKRLREETNDPKTARGRLALALAFDRCFDPKPLEKYLARREELGGLDDDDLHASLVLKIHGEDPGAVASLIARHRTSFEAGYEDPPIFTIEIQALALAGETSSARILMEKHIGELTNEAVAGLEALIAKAEGSDPVAEDLRVYQSSKTVEALRALVMSLARKKDHRAIAKYSEELYEQTSDPNDIARAAQAYIFLGDGYEFIRIIETYPFLQDREPGLTHRYAWDLFRTGRQTDARKVADRLANFVPSQRDLQLEIAIAIESWEDCMQRAHVAAFTPVLRRPRHAGARRDR